ncbi:MAG: hypothetical protein ACRDN6_07105 [Gaiellaceae bacterium]
MATVVQHVLTRAVPRTDGRSWLRWGIAVLAAVETVHFAAGCSSTTGRAGESSSATSFVLVTGLVVVGLTFGLLVRWGLEPSPRGRNRAALAGLAAGALSIASYAVYFTWAPLLIAPAAVLLGRAALARAHEGQGGRTYAVAGTFLGLASLAFGATMIFYAALHHGNYPWGL